MSRPSEASVRGSSEYERPSEGEARWQKKVQRQRRMFTNFCNSKLADRDDVPPITDIFDDLRDGRLLYALLEELSGQSLASLGKPRLKGKGGKPLTRIDHVSNLSISFRYIKQTTKIVGIGPGDIADGNPNLILGLLWSIIVFFAAKDLGGVDNVSALKKKILKWCQKRTERNDDVEIRNLKDSFMDGRGFLAILNDVDPTGFPYAPTTPTKNFCSAFKEAAEKYGVPELLDGDDEECWKDEQSMVTYLSEMMKRLPDSFKDPALEVMAWVDQEKDNTLEDLKRICAVPSTECASILKEIMEKDGLNDVVIHSQEQPPYVTGSLSADDTEKPTVLFVADYGVDTPTWIDAFVPQVIDDRLQAAGAAATKGGAMAAVKALSALIAALPAETKVSVNVEILLACGTPADYETNGPIETFLRERYAEKKPSVAIVDTAGAAGKLAPGKYSLSFGCRGEASVKVQVAMGTGPTEVRHPDTFVGPLLDVHQALCHQISKCRNHKTLAMEVPGLDGFKEPNKFTNAVKNVVDLTNGDSIVDGYGSRELALVPGVSITNQLMFYPGISVIDLVSDEKNKFGTASATMYTQLPPGFPHPRAVAALETCFAVNNWGAKVEVTCFETRSGFLTDPSAFLGKFADAASARFKERGCAVLSSPYYLPLAASVARALPSVAVVAAGVHDPDAFTEKEALRLDDLHSTIKTFIHLIMSLDTLPSTGQIDPDVVYPPPIPPASTS